MNTITGIPSNPVQTSFAGQTKRPRFSGDVSQPQFGFFGKKDKDNEDKKADNESGAQPQKIKLGRVAATIFQLVGAAIFLPLFFPLGLPPMYQAINNIMRMTSGKEMKLLNPIFGKPFIQNLQK